MSDGIIKLLKPEDAEVFKKIRLEALRSDPAAFASRSEDWEILSLDEWRSRLIEMPVFVAFQDDEPVAIMGLTWQKPSKMAHRATLIMVYVRASLRGTGLALKLLEQVTQHADAHGIRQIELAVSAENRAARRFYEREGFIEIGRIPGAFLHDGVEMDEIVMSRRIGAWATSHVS
ncbi:GNAT family N-acetyltransferase [Hyphomicrobiales bacterium]|jgi:RimJ/RimL family protein N-acetyltransferase|uniref:GNAT family N-acetyltransferase n=1 Tax=unclassified Rhizobium TaxID=2613769 RepID=UPI000DE0FB61